MGSNFLSEDFLLGTGQARRLYHEYARHLPIIDYHCHLSPKDIADNRQFATITEAWLEGDHYKWRAMRACGVDERFITGDASPREKFLRWAETVPKTIRNPLYHWTHMELQRPFGIQGRLLGPDTAAGIWEECNAKLATEAFSTQGLLRQMHVEAVCTTDDPVDTLEHHARLASNPAAFTRMYPAFRPDKAMAVDDAGRFAGYVERLGQAAHMGVTRYDHFIEALRSRHTFFHDRGCRLSDHGLETVYAEECTGAEAERIFSCLLRGVSLTPAEAVRFKSAVLYELALMDAERGWVQQFHLGALRNNNSRMLRTLGPDTGYDAIGDFPVAGSLVRFLDRLDSQQKLAKTILYNLNPRDNELLATVIGSFQDGTVAGKMQYGAAWWFLDQIDGMTRQLNALSAMGVLSQFIGMLTDSRSFLSYPRHDYFRRLLCGILGGEMEQGLIPGDMELVGKMVNDICYFNVQRYLALPSRAEQAAEARTPASQERTL